MSNAEIGPLLIRLGQSTTALIRAAESGDHEAIERTVEARADAVQELAEAAEHRGLSLAELIGQHTMLTIFEQAEEAERALEGFRRSLTDGLQGISRGRRAVRGYAANPVESSALDRAG